MKLDNQSKQSDRREEKMLRRHDDDDKFEGRENTSLREAKRPRRHDEDEFEHRLREDQGVVTMVGNLSQEITEGKTKGQQSEMISCLSPSQGILM
jgi:hypothetical protein